MKTENQKENISFPVVVAAGKKAKATLCGRSIAGVKFPAEMVSTIETKKELPKDWISVQFWVSKAGLIRSLMRGKKPGRMFLMGKFTLPDGKTKSVYIANAWLKSEALQYIKGYWDKQ